MTTTIRTVDANQGTTSTGHDFGYVHIGTGGFFFTWRYDAAARRSEQVRQIVATLEADETDPPTGRANANLRALAERELRAHIRQHGMR